MEILDEDSCRRTPALKIAYKMGQLAMLDEIKGLANNILIESQLNPFNVRNDYEEGQLSALNSMLEAVMTFEQALSRVTANEAFDA